MKLVCLGFGYVASFLSSLLLENNWEVIGTSRKLKDAKDAQMLVYPRDDKADEELISHLKNADAILLSAPPETKDPFLSVVEKALKQRTTKPWIGYLSATSVYGDHQGNVVDETSDCHPTSNSGLMRLQAEKDWQIITPNINIFRLSGIYGPNRSAFDRIKQNAPAIFKKDHVFSRIHVADIAKLLKASILQNTCAKIYNLADNEPSSQVDVMLYAAELLNLPAPQVIAFDQAQISPQMENFFKDSKRVNCQFILKELNQTLSYPSYREGLLSILESESKKL